VQNFEHEAIAAESHHDIRLAFRGVAVDMSQPTPSILSLGPIARDKRKAEGRSVRRSVHDCDQAKGAAGLST
jgi:hypothetical protein